MKNDTGESTSFRTEVLQSVSNMAVLGVYVYLGYKLGTENCTLLSELKNHLKEHFSISNRNVHEIIDYLVCNKLLLLREFLDKEGKAEDYSVHWIK